MRYRKELHLSWSPCCPHGSSLLILAVRQCQNNVMHDISTDCVIQSEICLWITASGASDCYWCVSFKGSSVSALNLKYGCAHFGTIHLHACANVCARDLKWRITIWLHCREYAFICVGRMARIELKLFKQAEEKATLEMWGASAAIHHTIYSSAPLLLIEAENYILNDFQFLGCFSWSKYPLHITIRFINS